LRSSLRIRSDRLLQSGPSNPIVWFVVRPVVRLLECFQPT
jgi:hypothetical protein